MEVVRQLNESGGQALRDFLVPRAHRSETLRPNLATNLKVLKLTIAATNVAVSREIVEKYRMLEKAGGSEFEQLQIRLLLQDKNQEPMERIRDLHLFRATLGRVQEGSLTPLKRWFLTAMSVTVFAILHASIRLDGLGKIVVLSLLSFIGWIALLAVSLANSFLCSVFAMLVLTVLGSWYIYTRRPISGGVVPRTEKVNSFAACVFVASGMFTLAGWFSPMSFSQALKRDALVGGFIDLRFILSFSFAIAFLVVGTISAIVNVWNSEKASARIKRPVNPLEVLQGLPANIRNTAKHLFAPIVLPIETIVQAQRWTAEIVRHLWKSIVETFSKQIYLAALSLFVKILGTWFIVFGCHKLGAGLVEYLNDESGIFEGPLQWKKAMQLFWQVALCVVGLHLLTYRYHMHYTRRNVPGKLLPIVFAAWLTGGTIWLLHARHRLSGVEGFRSIGLFVVMLPLLLLVVSGVSIYRGAREEPDSDR